MSATARREDFRSCGHGRVGSAPDPEICPICREVHSLQETSRALDRRINRRYRTLARGKPGDDIRALQALHADVIQKIVGIVFPPLPPVDTSEADALIAKYAHLLD